MSIFYLIIAISILILIHEAGHFYAARFFKVKVEEFGFGFPPRVFSVMRRGIRYSFNALPFGGFVKIFGEHGEGEENRESFAARPGWQRFLILGAGVGMNAALAWMLFSAAAGIGLPRAGDTAAGVPVSIIAVMPDSPADAAGLKLGDEIMELGSRTATVVVSSEDDVSAFTRAHRGEEITVVVLRAGEIRSINATLRGDTGPDEGPLGIAMGRLGVVRVPLYRAPVEGAKMLWWSTGVIVFGFADILRELLFEWNTNIPVAGPIGIFVMGADIGVLGISYFLQFIALISVNLAVLNVLPIPALDGGRIFFVAIEKLKGSRINPRFENAAHATGFVFLLLLLMLVTYKDVMRIVY